MGSDLEPRLWHRCLQGKAADREEERYLIVAHCYHTHTEREEGQRTSEVQHMSSIWIMDRA